MRGENWRFKVPYMINRRESLKRLKSQTLSQTLESYVVMPLSPISFGGLLPVALLTEPTGCLIKR